MCDIIHAGVTVDWVDFKRFCARYRGPYTSLAGNCEALLFSVLKDFSTFRKMGIDGVDDEICVEQLGVVLHSMAEIESLTIDYQSNGNYHNIYEWNMVERGITILRLFRYREIDDSEFLTQCSRWVRTYYGVVYTSRLFTRAMLDRKYNLQKLHGY